MAVPTSGGVGTRNSRLRILVADDNDMIRSAVRGPLRGLGPAVEAASDRREALAMDDFLVKPARSSDLVQLLGPP